MTLLAIRGTLAAAAPGSISDAAAATLSASALTITFTSASAATSHQARYAPKIRQVDSGGTVSGLSTGWWSAPATVTSGGTLTSLDPQVEYEVQVRGLNSTVGEWSNTATGSTSTIATNHSGFAAQTSTGNDYVDGLLASGKWIFSGSPKVLSYSFPTSKTSYTGFGDIYPISNGNAIRDAFVEFPTDEKNKFRKILAGYQQLVDLRFVEITETSTAAAIIRFALTTDTAHVPTAIGSFPASKSTTGGVGGAGGDMWFGHVSQGGFWGNPVSKGTYQWHGYVHELGHALGLSHPHDGGFNHVPLDKDGMEYTVMSYRSSTGGALAFTNPSGNYVTTPMMLDITALQTIYGARYDTKTGDTTYSFSSTTGEMFVNGVGQGAPSANKIYLTIWDGGGSDTYDFVGSAYAAGSISANTTAGSYMRTISTQLPDLGEGHNSKGTIYNAQNFGSNSSSNIESALVP